MIELVFEHCDARALDSELVEASAAVMQQVLTKPTKTVVVVSGNFVESVKSRLDDAEYRARYSDERPEGIVGAKTIRQADGTVTVVLNAGLLTVGSLRYMVTRTCAHESYHALLHHSSEVLPIAMQSPRAEAAMMFFRGLASIAVEEYRVERALNDSGIWLDDSYQLGFGRDLDDSAAALRDAVICRYPNEPINRCYCTTLAVFHGLVVRLSYLAAEHLASQGQRSVESRVRTHSRWTRLVGRHWDSLLRVFAAVPSAQTRVQTSSLEAPVQELAPILKTWLLDIGFDFDGEAFWVRRHEF